MLKYQIYIPYQPSQCLDSRHMPLCQAGPRALSVLTQNSAGLMGCKMTSHVNHRPIKPVPFENGQKSIWKCFLWGNIYWKSCLPRHRWIQLVSFLSIHSVPVWKVGGVIYICVNWKKGGLHSLPSNCTQNSGTFCLALGCFPTWCLVQET